MENDLKLRRFFIALLPPAAVRDYANEIKQHFSDRYQSRAAQKSPPHITLQPPFEWPMAELNCLKSVLTTFAAQQPSVPIRLSGFGAFPPRVIYIDVQHTDELMALQTQLSQYLEKQLNIVDTRSQNRPFRPHLTVAFRDLKPKAFRLAWPRFEAKSAEFAFKVSQLTLLIHDGKRWTVARNFRFGTT
ncbi:MAG: 2'-5' RNA ligase family protein [Leptolyngbya sp. SIO4C5]|nr:2'-5' RNA ligase family protein [Leptolyngbya sp. SIO4C5]